MSEVDAGSKAVGVEHLPYKVRLRELGCSTWRRGDSRRLDSNLSVSKGGAISKKRTDSSEGSVVTGQGETVSN